MTLDKEAAATAAQSLAEASAEDVLAWAGKTLRGGAVFATSLGMEDQVITHMIAAAGLPIPLFTLDTGRLFPETYELIQQTERRYGLRIRVLSPDANQLEALVAERGVNLFRESVENRRLCCQVRKIEPLRRVLRYADGWVCGLRAEQSPDRAVVAPVGWDEENHLPKVCPLHAWTWDQVRAYVVEHQVPVNPLHEQGFVSIGCACCTRAIRPGDPFRSGRWWWEADTHKECGLHPPVNRKPRPNLQQPDSRPTPP
jgi:phosphoadenosine phosphosulfate reductase